MTKNHVRFSLHSEKGDVKKTGGAKIEKIIPKGGLWIEENSKSVSDFNGVFNYYFCCENRN